MWDYEIRNRIENTLYPIAQKSVNVAHNIINDRQFNWWKRWNVKFSISFGSATMKRQATTIIVPPLLKWVHVCFLFHTYKPLIWYFHLGLIPKLSIVYYRFFSFQAYFCCILNAGRKKINTNRYRNQPEFLSFHIWMVKRWENMHFNSINWFYMKCLPHFENISPTPWNNSPFAKYF